MNTESDIAWAAGLFEGEGCIFVKESTKDRVIGPRLKLALSITDRDVLDRFFAIVGRGHIDGPYQRQSHHKPIWTWRTEGTVAVIRILKLFVPYLGERRSAKAEEALEAAWTRVIKAVQRGSEDTLLGVRVRAHPFHQLAEALGEE